ncbi:MAG: PKD domain-containing protein, partial [Mycobacterium sp.]
HTWATISEGWEQTCGVTTAGAGYCWGPNDVGQLGIGNTTSESTPTLVTGGHTWSSISMGGDDACGVTTAGAGYCWGQNSNGEDGNNTTTQEDSPVSVNGSHTWASISESNLTSCGLTTAGVGYCWGYNDVGQLGNGNTTDQHTPAAISGSLTFSAISTGMETAGAQNTGCGTTTTGVEYCWGYNNKDQVGDGTTTNRSVPTAVVWPSSTAASTIAPGGPTNCSITNYNAYCWGNDTYGQLGNGTTTAATVPTLVSGGYQWKSISTVDDDYDTTALTCGVTTAGAGYCWGRNDKGQVGDNTTTQRTVPTAVNGGYTWASISVGGEDACGVTTAGAGYCWGYNEYGEVGDGTTTERNVPTAVGGSHTWATISEGWEQTCGVTTAGAGYCWGPNDVGQLGIGNTTSESTPTLVTGGHTWSSISMGGDDACGVTTAGAGYCWGQNSNGEDGNNTTTQEDSPVSVNGSHTWASISESNLTSCGLTTAGVGYCWGYNDVGQLGNGNTTDQHTPAAISGGLTFSAISTGMETAGAQNTGCGTTTTGTEYCWGYNNKDQVGDGTTTNRSVPTAVVWPSSTPNPPSSLAQFKSDGITSISTGGTTSDTTVVFSATVSDPDPAGIDSLCVEIVPTADTFTNSDTTCGSPVSTGSTATASVSGLINGTSYKWQARTKNASSQYSSWVSFDSGSTAFSVGSPPTASFTHSTASGAGPLLVAFDASASTAVSPATITGYSWIFGDGGTGTGVAPEHLYTTAGTYTVTLTVTDSNSQTDSTTSTVTIGSTPALQFDLTWSNGADVDLYATEPDGNFIYYGNPGPSSTGGALNGDDRGACVRSNANNGAEATSWATAPPAGTYLIDVDQYDTCGGGDASWTLHVIDNGTVVQTNTGTGTATDISYDYSGS